MKKYFKYYFLCLVGWFVIITFIKMLVQLFKLQFAEAFITFWAFYALIYIYYQLEARTPEANEILKTLYKNLKN